MCEYPWSDRDLFQYVSGCHIYVPALISLMSLSIIFAIVAFTCAASEFFKRSRRNIPIVCMFNEFLFIISWISCLGSNKTFVSGNYLLNLIFGIGKGGFYLTVQLFTLRNAEVLLVMDRIKPKRDPSLQMAQFIMKNVIVFLSIPIKSLAVTLPIAFPEQFPMVNTVLYVQLVLAGITSPVSWIYLYKLKKKSFSSRNVTRCL